MRRFDDCLTKSATVHGAGDVASGGRGLHSVVRSALLPECALGAA